MSFTAYKVLHLLGVLVLFTALGGLIAMRLAGSRAAGSTRKLVGALHGVALLLILVAGFGMMARLGIIAEWPPWIWLKLLIWAVLGGSVALAGRLGAGARALFVILPLLGLLAAAAALYHLGA